VGILARIERKGKPAPMESTSFYSQILGISSPWRIVKGVRPEWH